jgi:ubiquinone/menaquinone biosynthesis C-methylase UbiE
MLSIADFTVMVVQQQGKQRLQRTEEPENITAADANVIQYDQAMATKLALSYAAGLETIHRVRSNGATDSAVDLACGPGHYTACLARYLDYSNVIGMDLSAPMVNVATRNLPSQQLEDRVRFAVQDITALDTIEDGKFQLASFTGAAHHMPDLTTVSGIVRNMDRITTPNGLVMVMDLARLRTAELTEKYIKLLAADYVQRNLPAFLEDFRNSMYAVWTPSEFREVIPKNSARWWCHLVPRGLPTVQIILGLPVGRRQVFARSGFRPEEHPLIREWYPRWQKSVSPQWADETLKEWKLMRMTLAFASKKLYPPIH